MASKRNTRRPHTSSDATSDGDPQESIVVKLRAGTPAEAEVLERLARLNDEPRARTSDESPLGAPQLDQPLSRRLRRIRLPSKSIKSLLAIAFALALGWVHAQRLLATTSAEAIVNARVTTLRAPINGKVSVIAPTLVVGTPVDPRERLLQVSNVPADRSRRDDLRRTIRTLDSESAALSKRFEQLKSIEANLRIQRDAFQEGHIRQLEARNAEFQVQIRSDEALHADAEEALERSEKLNATGSHPIATLLRAERDYKVSKLAIEAARLRLQANQIELEAAHRGLFFGDSYNDLPAPRSGPTRSHSKS
jgi:hypothetical protein